MMSKPTPDQMNALLQYASAKLGVSADELASTVASGGYDQLTSSLSDNSKKALESMLGDPQKAKALLSSPQVQEFLKRFS